MDKPTPIKKPRPLTTKQKKFIKAKIEGKSGIQAAKEAYGVTSNNVANAIAVENLQKPTIAQALEIAFEKQGITMHALVKPLADGLVANRVVQVEGDFFETDVPDHATRIKAAGLAGQWLGIGKQANEGGGPSIHFHNHSGEKKQDYGF